MEAIEFPQANLILRAGENTNTNDLIAGRALSSDGKQCIVAKFQLELDEIKEIEKQGCIYISVVGDRWSLIFLSTFDPYEKHGYIKVDPKGMPDNFPYRQQFKDLVFKVFYDKETMTKEYMEEFIGYLNMSMPMSFPELSQTFATKLENEKILISAQMMELEGVLNQHKAIERVFRKGYEERKTKSNGHAK
jgi:hypothetical protein